MQGLRKRHWMTIQDTLQIQYQDPSELTLDLIIQHKSLKHKFLIIELGDKANKEYKIE